MGKKIIIIGGGGHARSVIAVMKRGPAWDVVGYTDAVSKGRILGVPWLGTDKALSRIRKVSACRAAVIGVGNAEISRCRRDISARLVALGFELPVVIAASAIVNEGARILAGTVVLEGAIINTGVRIGRCCIVNTGAVIDHDCRIADLVHVAPGTVLSGSVKVGAGTLLGTGCRVIQGVTIGRDCLIGAGAAVVGDIRAAGTYVGVPARRMGAL
jgi:UDP-perosamine 4-acetyltransferase